MAKHWLPHHLLEMLRDDIAKLQKQGAFRISGLTVTDSTRVIEDPHDDGRQGAPFARSRYCCVFRPGLGGNEEARRSVDSLLEGLRADLEVALGRRLLLSEQYYSIMPVGSRLAWHMDERHEETKGEDAWALSTRRSISWLLYLSEDGWDATDDDAAGAGGTLRAFCKRGVSTDGAGCGAYEGDLQVGWIELNATNSEESLGAAPVFLDAWLRPEEVNGHPECALYCVDGHQDREYLTGRIQPTEFGGVGMTANTFAEMLCNRLPLERQSAFSSVLKTFDATEHDMIDVSPEGGTLVLFDSVCVGHEVTPVMSGERLALAGWFHEPQQSWPEWW